MFRVVIRGASLRTSLQFCLSYLFSVTDVLEVQGLTYSKSFSSLKAVLTMISPLVCKLFSIQTIWSSLLWINAAGCWTITLSILYGSIGMHLLAHSHVQLQSRRYITVWQIQYNRNQKLGCWHYNFSFQPWQKHSPPPTCSKGSNS